MKFKNKNILITGGSRGLGLALSEEFAREGADIMILARDAQEIEAVQDSLQRQFPLNRFFTLEADLCDVKSYDIIRDAIDKNFGSLDVLVNNAGAIMIGPFSSMTEEDFRSQMEIHLFAALKMIKIALNHFEKQGSGQIVNICSMGGKVAVPHMLTYDASKFALAGLSQGLAAELKEKNIFITTVYPAVMMTGSPIQAIFKGDQAKSFDWFACTDYMPFIALPAEKAARKIIKAAHNKKAELIMPWFANLRVAGSALLPNLMISTMRFIHKLLPKGESSLHRSGFEVKNEAHYFQKYFSKKAQEIEHRWNQKGKTHEKVLQKMPSRTKNDTSLINLS